MNLCIDIGNTRSKLGLFKDRELLESAIANTAQLSEAVSKIMENYPDIDQIGLLATGDIPDDIQAYLESHTTVRILDHTWEVPFQNRYRTPQTLGLDRIALVSAACLRYPNTNRLIIDTGTCITYDFINMQNDYLGGAISPGMHMRYKAMHEHTARLPNLYPDTPDGMLGDTTDNSMHSGVVNGIAMEIDGWIDHHLAEYEDLTVILTGGDIDFLSKSLKNAIFAHSNFLLEGLNYLLEINNI